MLRPKMEGDIAAATEDIFGNIRKLKKKHAKNRNDTKDGDKTSAEGSCKKRMKTEVQERPNNGESASIESRVFRGLNVAEFLEARALEVSNTVQALEAAAKMEGKRVMQRLPRHMRRRAASYDIRRIPRSQRKMAAKEEGNNPIKKTKMPSRKYRRRPKKLLEEYNRRKRKHAWLETHIWHAKRFKMTEQWGYKIAEQPNDKGLRSAYRASANGCLMQDISFHGCIEITGPQDKILKACQYLCHESTGANVAAKAVLSGERSCVFVLYNCNKHPYNPVGPVEAIWQPVFVVEEMSSSNRSKVHAVPDSNIRKLWIWCHPSCQDEAAAAIKLALTLAVECDVSKVEKMETDDSDCTMIDGGLCNTQKNEDATVGVSGQKTEIIPTIFSKRFKVDENISINSMKLDLFKIRLTGPLSHRVLYDALQLHRFKESDTKHWWNHSESNSEILEQSFKTWEILKEVSSPSELPSHAVFGMTVIDPRLNIPIKKTWWGSQSEEGNAISSENTKKKTELLTKWPSDLGHSQIWDEQIREEVKKTKITEGELNKRRSAKLDIGERLGIEDDTSRIPILLIQRPGGIDATNTMSDYGCGWDVILPSGWGMAFWVSLVYRGAHASGQREERSISLETRKPHFPTEYPDTKSGREFLLSDIARNEEKYNRRPASKRPNYQKLGIQSPFGPEWNTLVKEWTENSNSILSCLDSARKTKQQVSDVIMASPIKNADKSLSTIEAMSCSSACSKEMENFYVLRDKTLLIELQDTFHSFKAKKRGNHSYEQRSFSIDGMRRHLDGLLGKLLEVHSNALLAISFDCIGRGEGTNNAVISVPDEVDLEKIAADRKYCGPLEPLHKGRKDTFRTISDAFGIRRSLVKQIGSCTRWTIGHVTSGRYSLRNGRSGGLGFVTVTGLIACLKGQKSLTDGCIVLFRNVNSQQYRFAELNIVV